MERIRITEIDATTPGAVVSPEEVVYVPGFVHTDYATNKYQEAYIPYLCTTVSQFEQKFGDKVPVFSAPQSYTASTKDSKMKGFAAAAIAGVTKMFENNEMDPGYVYAKELLNQGIPVLYERMNATPKVKTNYSATQPESYYFEGHEDELFDTLAEANASQLSMKHMYEVLSENERGRDVQVWENLKDINEYAEVKYLTSGGYPSFEYYSGQHASVTYAKKYLNSVEIEEQTFIEATGAGADTDYEIIYARPYLDVKASVETEAQMEVLATENIFKIGTYFYVSNGVNGENIYQLKSYEEKTEKSVKVLVPHFEALENWKTWFIQKRLTPETYVPIALSDYGLTITWISEDLPTREMYGTMVEVSVKITNQSTIVNKMLYCAESRGDCVALIDHTNNPYRKLDATNVNSVYYSVSSDESPYKIKSNGEYGAMFTPWCECDFLTLGTQDGVEPYAMPASFVYLMALAKSIKSNASWMAVAGVARGVANIIQPKLYGSLRISNAIADSYQARNAIGINAITNVKPYGYLIWGNRTLKNNAIEGNITATSLLNTRNMVSEIKKVAYSAAKRCMFEQNSDILWINYKAKVAPTLDRMVSAGALTNYKIIKENSDMKAQLKCTIRIFPTYAVESFDITIEMADEEVSVS